MAGVEHFVDDFQRGRAKSGDLRKRAESGAQPIERLVERPNGRGRPFVAELLRADGLDGRKIAEQAVDPGVDVERRFAHATAPIHCLTDNPSARGWDGRSSHRNAGRSSG